MAFNHHFAFGFAVSGSSQEDGEDVSGARLRQSIQSWLNELSDEELKQVVGYPADTIEEDGLPVQRVIQEVQKMGPFGAVTNIRDLVQSACKELGVTLTPSQVHQVAYELGFVRLQR